MMENKPQYNSQKFLNFSCSEQYDFWGLKTRLSFLTDRLHFSVRKWKHVLQKMM